MNFDPKNKENKVLIKYFEGKSYLIIDPGKLIRVTLKKIMNPLKPEVYEANPTDQLSVCEKLIKTHKPHVVFCAANIHGESFTKLLDIHTLVQPDRFNASFIIISEDENVVDYPEVRDDAVDGVILPPFSMQSIQDAAFDIFKRKLSSSKEARDLYQATIPYYEQEYQKALDSLEELVAQYPQYPNLYNYLGKTCAHLNRHEEAIQYFQEGVRFNDEHYGCLYEGLQESLKLDKFKVAYEFATGLIASHTIAVKLVPTLVKVSIANKGYEDIFTYAGILEQQEAGLSQEQKHFMATGLTLCAQKFVESLDKKKTEKALTMATKWAGTRLNILRKICHVYFEIKQFKPVKDILKFVSENVEVTQEVEIFDFEMETFFMDPDYLMTEGPKYIKRGIKSPAIYENIIKCSIALKRKKDMIEDLIYEAKKDFPDDAGSFDKYLQQI